ncbi:MAG: hypothetical protein LBU65_12885 [Planctomycetaceae bacterium]|nr:hypothetical protein [Planctomycetaceae bacterium]
MTNEIRQSIKEILGYLNFSSGNRDTKFYVAVNQLYEFLFDECDKVTTVYSEMILLLRDELAELSQLSDVFRKTDQAERVLDIVNNHFFAAYRKYHSELLFHQTNLTLFTPFFLARTFETILALPIYELETDEIVEQAIFKLDDLLGYRPVPVLEGHEKHQPDAHEWVAPIPLYVDGAGVAFGRYQRVIEIALELLRGTPEDILREAGLHTDKIQEIVLDPRAYDFDHPVNRRPNYHFGTWDPDFIDKQGFYRRFVIHQMTIDCIVQRYETAYMGESESPIEPLDVLQFEAGAVLAGTMLMGSGITGDNPHTYSSDVSLSTLMPIIAAYRDRFYEHLQKVRDTSSKIAKRKKTPQSADPANVQQPFGGARQDLNKRLAKRRADQLQRLHLSRTYARMGYFDAAEKQADIIAVPSARILCKIDCLITQSHLLADHDKFAEAAALLPQIEDLLHRGIACGSIVDPWTILGFAAQYSLFAAVDNTIHDHRVDDLITLIDSIFDLYSRLQKESAAGGMGDLQADLSDKMSDLAGWWDQFGSTEVSGIEGFSGMEAWESAAKVATALAAWNKASSAAGDIAFWNRHVERFKSPKAFVLLGEALLDQCDPVAAMALLMHWLSQSETIALTEVDYSFHAIVLRWIEELWGSHKSQEALPPKKNRKRFTLIPLKERWGLTQKFFDYIEANADRYWSVPNLELEDSFFKSDANNDGLPTGKDTNNIGENDEPTNAIDSTFSAAYENVTYHDTANDGIDDDMMDSPGSTAFNVNDDDFELGRETDRISDRLLFLVTIAKLWKFAASKIPTLNEHVAEQETIPLSDVAERFNGWLTQAMQFWDGIMILLHKTASYEVPTPSGTQDSLMEYDRQRGTKEILLDRIIWTAVETADTVLVLQSVLGITAPKKFLGKCSSWQGTVLPVFAAIYRGDVKLVKKHWGVMMKKLSHESLLYIPTSRGGNADDIALCRILQQCVLRLLEYSPRLGLLTEAFQLLEVIQQMEHIFPQQAGAITEFDRLVETVTRAIVKSISESSKHWKVSKDSEFKDADEALVDYMERIVELLLSAWLSHSKQIRISPVESIIDKNVWIELKLFIQKYGKDLFTQQFMGFGNLRAVLHQGVDNYLNALIKIKEEEGELEQADKLITDLIANKFPFDEAVYNLELIFEAIAENYSEYIDYNSTTTHSDHGDRLYMLLDMLRVQTGYERVSWNLKPVYWVHDALIRCGCPKAASLWERAVAKRSINAAEEHLRNYDRLSEKYGLWLPSVHERLQERFVRPLHVARMCGLVPTAVRQAREDGEKTAFVELDKQVEMFAREPMGVGFEMPEWLSSLQEEVISTRPDEAENKSEEDALNPTPMFEQVRFSRSELDAIIIKISRSARFGH